jgi:hypothetical protein
LKQVQLIIPNFYDFLVVSIKEGSNKVLEETFKTVAELLAHSDDFINSFFYSSQEQLNSILTSIHSTLSKSSNSILMTKNTHLLLSNFVCSDRLKESEVLIKNNIHVYVI